MQIIAENITYTFPSGKNILRDIGFSLPEGEKAAMVGDNGSGKSALLRILTGSVTPDSGTVYINERHWTIPQHFGQYDCCTIGQVLRVQDKIDALREIENGSADPRHFDVLADDWAINERLQAALEQWNLPGYVSGTPFSFLSGGEKTRTLLAGITVHQPQLVLMDEPTNHLDTSGRELLGRFIRESTCDFLIVSHDRELLNLCNPIYELSSLGIRKYGGNYAFYQEQKQMEMEAVEQRIRHTKQSIADAKRKYRETMERKQKLNARGEKKAKKGGLPRIVLNAARNRAESSTAKLSNVHEHKIEEERERLQELKNRQRELKDIRITLSDSVLHKGKVLFKADRINYAFGYNDPLWEEPLNFVIQSGDRIHITGDNGSGKSTLIRLLNREINPTAGTLTIQSERRFILDQEYRLIDREATVLEQAVALNKANRPDHQLKTLLHRHLFEEKVWDQPCKSLSGGEMMRLSLCCLALQTEQPDTIVLDEPTNNLDLRNIGILAEAISDYQGTLIVVSHDKQFVEEIGVGKTIAL